MATGKITNYQYNVDKMYTYLKGFACGANMQETLKALSFAREKHRGQTRKNGVPYIVHPLSMACYAVALGIKEDSVIATVLLHDVAEDCGVDVGTMPFSEKVRTGVKYMTIQPLSSEEDKMTMKKRYYKELLNSREAVLAKALDRYNNLSDMPFALSEKSVGKNAAETELFLLPVLKEAKDKWADIADILFVLRTNIRSVNDLIKLQYEDIYNEWVEEYSK